MTHTPAKLMLLLSAVAFLTGCAAKAPPTPTTTPSLAEEKDRKSASGPEKAINSVGDGISNFFESISQLARNIGGDTPVRYAKLTQSDSPDERRIGINGLVERDFGKRPPYTDRYLDIAQGDPDPLVRAVAIRALNLSRDKRVTEVCVKALADQNVAVRLEAAKALHRLPDPAATAPLLATLNNPSEDKDVRIAAAEALRHYKTLEVARALVGNLGNRDFGIAFQSRRSLKLLFNRDLKYDEAAWLAYLTGPEKPVG